MGETQNKYDQEPLAITVAPLIPMDPTYDAVNASMVAFPPLKSTTTTHIATQKRGSQIS